MDQDLNSEEQQFRNYINSPKHQSRSSSHEAGHAVVAERLGYMVFHVSTMGEIVLPDSPEAGLVSNGELAAIGGSIEIGWGMLCPNDQHFDIDLQNIATVLMGGRAAEELTHPDSPMPIHWKKDVEHFKELIQKCRRTEQQADDLLEEGHRRAKELLNNPEIAIEHLRVRSLLMSGAHRTYPNGELVRKAIRGEIDE